MKAPKLIGVENYEDWADAILLEADQFGARAFLLSTNEQAPAGMTIIEVARWSAFNAVLRNRIETSLSVEVKRMFPILPEMTACAIWNRLQSMY